MESESCQSREASDYPDADPKEQAVLISVGAAYLATALYTMWRKKPGLLPLWLAAVATWATLPKYLICTRCECYGKPCDFTYGGRYSAKLFKPQPDRTVDVYSLIAEGVPGAVAMMLPFAVARKSQGLLTLFGLLSLLWQVALIKIACIRCVRYSTDPFKRKYCPNYKIAGALGSVLREGI
ncbi:MAG: hypothetical protein KKB90_05400 [Actinobacteria bacterium]|nr:hypothetical protein [Actinomycetota bacterium]MCG2818137.1 hypothetical protein [Actinomycetes bacterium]MBU4179583.1 hypothetical protein [Actinomycetota bacterium]MBU4218383.1 hypothetical protein [Actinomycetota bacterium]MBU4359417.1 hypothetical protein [Actinomycetota bacterium]